MSYEVMHVEVEQEYSDEYQTMLVVAVRRDDGLEGDVWVSAGVPDYLRGTADAARTHSGLKSVRFGDFGVPWNNGTELPLEDADAVLEAVRPAAMKAHREWLAAEGEEE